MISPLAHSPIQNPPLTINTGNRAQPDQGNTHSIRSLARQTTPQDHGGTLRAQPGNAARLHQMTIPSGEPRPAQAPRTRHCSNLITKLCCACCGSLALSIVGGAFAYYILSKSLTSQKKPFSLFPLNFTDCTPDQIAALKAAHSRAVSIINATLEDPEVSLQADDQERLYACFSEQNISCVTLTCADALEPCQDNNTLGYYEEDPTEPSDIYLCLDNISKNTNDTVSDLCATTEVLVHETAHYVKIPSSWVHSPNSGNDRVYRVGRAAKSACLAYSDGLA